MKNKSSKKKVAPKLPRFIAPKSMISKVYVDKKRKSKTRASLKKLLEF